MTNELAKFAPTVDEALALVEQERLDDLANLEPGDEYYDAAPYVLASEVRRLRAVFNSSLRARLEEIAEALDDALGDTDATHLESDEEIREAYPVQWACSEVNKLLHGTAVPEAAAMDDMDKRLLAALVNLLHSLERDVIPGDAILTLLSAHGAVQELSRVRAIAERQMNDAEQARIELASRSETPEFK